jgi:hypothetical protein
MKIMVINVGINCLLQAGREKRVANLPLEVGNPMGGAPQKKDPAPKSGTFLFV